MASNGGALEAWPHLDDAGARVRDDARHLHGIPPRSLAHDVAVEGVENALVRKLEAVVQNHQVRRLLRLRGVAFRLQQR